MEDVIESVFGSVCLYMYVLHKAFRRVRSSSSEQPSAGSSNFDCITGMEASKPESLGRRRHDSHTDAYR